MKKLVALILAALLLTGCALAEDWQAKLAEYSLEELQEMAAAYDAEIIRRTKESFEVPTGTYIVGEDLPAGTYSVDYVNNAGILGLYDSQRALDTDDPYFFEIVSKTERIGKVTLKAGDILTVDATVSFSLYKGLGW